MRDAGSFPDRGVALSLCARLTSRDACSALRVPTIGSSIGLVFSEAPAAEVTPGYVPFIVTSTGHAETCAEGQHLPWGLKALNTHEAPNGPGPRSGNKSRAVRRRGALRHLHR
jgi:hypothetical protein